MPRPRLASLSTAIFCSALLCGCNNEASTTDAPVAPDPTPVTNETSDDERNEPAETSPETQRVLDAATEAAQTAEYVKVVELLADVDHPEASYLRAVAFQAGVNNSTARLQIAGAVKADPKNAKYLACQARIDLAAGDSSAAERLIDLQQEHPASAAVNYFAFFGYEYHRAVRGMAAQKTKDEKQRTVLMAASNQFHKNGLNALKASVDLCASVPELQAEMLGLAIRFRLPEQAMFVAERLRQADPENDEWTRGKIEAALLAKQVDVAEAESRKLFEVAQESEQAALTFAKSMARTTYQTDRDDEFAELIQAFPQSEGLPYHYAAWLARNDRLGEGTDVLNAAVERQQDEVISSRLRNVSIVLPLDKKDAKVARRQFDKHAEKITLPVMREFYEARLALVEKQPLEAAQLFADMAKKHRDLLLKTPGLAVEVAKWGQIALQAAAIQKQRDADKSGDANAGEDANPKTTTEPSEETDGSEG